MREWLKSALNSDGASDIQEMLQQCRLQDAGFCYKVFSDSEKRLTGFMFTTSEGGMLLEKYCDVLFDDFKASAHGISTCRWPYGTLSVIDEENHSVICVHVMVIVECNDAYEIMLETCTTWYQ